MAELNNAGLGKFSNGIDKALVQVSVLIILSSYLFFFKLGSLALTDPDETFYAQTAREMIETDEWMTPYIYGRPQFEKPILIYWLIKASFMIFGVNEFSARLPAAVSGVVGVFGLYFLGWLFFNRRTGFLSALMLASSVEYVILSRACVTDMVLTALMLLGVLSFFYGYLKEKRYSYLLSSLAFSIAVLVKGPIALFLPVAAMFLYLLLVRDLKVLVKIPFASCLLVFLVIAAPWYILMYKLHGNSFIDSFFGFHNIARFFESEHKIGSQWYYNIPIVFGGFFPWSIFLPVGFWHVIRKGPGARGQRPGLFLLIWFFVIFIFFSTSSTKLPTYIFPSFMSLALITGRVWNDFLEGDLTRPLNIGMRSSFYILMAIAALGAVGAVIYISYDYPAISGGIFIATLFLIFGFAVSLAAFMNKKYVAAFFLIIYSLAIFLYPISILVLPQLERFEASKEVARKLSSLMKPGEKLGAESNYLAGLAFYMGLFPLDIDKHHILVKFLDSNERVWCVMKEKNHRQLYELDTKPIYTKPSYMVYILGKRAIVTNSIREDGKFIVKRERLK